VIKNLTAASTFALACAALPAIAPAQIRIATYNTATAFNSNGNPNPGLQTVLGGVGSESFNGITKRIDILALQEQNNTTGTTTQQALNMMNALYGPGTYNRGTLIAGATSNPNTDSSAVIYDSTRFALVGEKLVGTPSTSGMPRQEIRYQFRPVSYGANSDFYVYVGHWKALGGATDMNRRNVEAQTIRADANTLPAGSRILYTGDFNLTGGTSEAAWATITAPGNGQGIDPANGSWANRWQTYSSTNLGSRLDFQMVTPPTNDDRGFSIIDNSYRTFGNNGTTPLGAAADSGTNTALPGHPNRAAVLGALTTASDHYPVVADYRYPARMSVAVGTVPPRVIVGGSASVNVTVTNTAPVLVAAGADGLDYTVTGTGSLTGGGVGTMLLALSAGNVHAMSFDTSLPGLRSGTVSAASTSQEVADGSFTQNVSTTVLAHANASFNPTDNKDILLIDFGIRARGAGSITSNFAIHNLPDPSGFTAALDLDQIDPTGSVAQLGANVATFTNLAPGGSVTFAASLDTASVGSFSSSYLLQFSDEDLPGAGVENTLLALTARVAIGGDANLDNAVNLNDFNVLAANFGSSGATWTTGDFTNDAVVNLNDFNVLAANFGLSATGQTVTPDDWARLGAGVPEPSTACAVAALLIASRPLSRRRRILR
jgi:endonuclease/exonuclease/phosphatase family metal-dependent hydrolase